jgi:hypothetical protein
MKLRILAAGAGLLLGIAGSALAGSINCKQVNKYLQTGRSVKDVAETMVISESEVQKCQAEAGEAKGGAEKAGETKGAEPGTGEPK